MNATIWKISVPGGEPRRLRENAFAWSVSPDGSEIAFGAHEGRHGPREAWLMGPSGENARKLYDADENSAIGPVLWSADGQRICYVRSSEEGDVAYSRDLKGGPPLVMLSQSDLNSTPGTLMLPDNRILYSIQEPGAPENTCNFWTAKVDPQTLKPVEKLRRLTNWTGFCMDPTSVTRDGRRIAFLKWTSYRTIYMADLNAGRVGQSRHFTLDETGNSPIDWTPDGKYVVFWSVRNGSAMLFKQGVDGDNEETILSVPGALTEPVVSADGKWVIWQSESTAGEGWRQLMRVSIDGGPPQVITRMRTGSQAQCARLPSTTCILAERTEDRNQVVITQFDPLRGRGPQLAKFDVDAAEKINGRLSGDGCCFALLTGLEGPIRVISLRGRPERNIATPGANAKQFIRWSANGNGWYVTNRVKGGMDLYFVDTAGHSRKLWHNDGYFPPIAMESPDGRRIAIQGSTLENNLWLMEIP